MSGNHTGTEYDLSLIMDGNVQESGLPHGKILNEFVEAIMDRDKARIAAARTTTVETLGKAAMMDAAATISAFNAYTRMADATGIPLETPKAEATVELRQELGLESLNKG